MEATHKLTQEEVPAWMDKYFQDAWTHYDQNGEGYIRYEESHTFMRFLMGHKTKFVGAPGSITDMTTGGSAYKGFDDDGNHYKKGQEPAGDKAAAASSN